MGNQVQRIRHGKRRNFNRAAQRSGVVGTSVAVGYQTALQQSNLVKWLIAEEARLSLAVSTAEDLFEVTQLMRPKSYTLAVLDIPTTVYTSDNIAAASSPSDIGLT